MSYTEADKVIAQHALHDLMEARQKPRQDVLPKLKRLCSESANINPNDLPERADAWLAICRLRDAIDDNFDHPDLPALWDKATALTRAWLDRMQIGDVA